eukprot:14485603-Alexandrium_andersonii.AAC.1
MRFAARHSAFPYRLSFLDEAATVSDEAVEAAVGDLLNASTCCLDSGVGEVLQDALQHAAPGSRAALLKHMYRSWSQASARGVSAQRWRGGFPVSFADSRAL